MYLMINPNRRGRMWSYCMFKKILRNWGEDRKKMKILGRSIHRREEKFRPSSRQPVWNWSSLELFLLKQEINFTMSEILDISHKGHIMTFLLWVICTKYSQRIYNKGVVVLVNHLHLSFTIFIPETTWQTFMKFVNERLHYT